jgi:hypothetical protein
MHFAIRDGPPGFGVASPGHWAIPYLKDRASNQAVWPGPWPKKAAQMLREDLAVAGIPYRDESGHVCDFHALRHSFVTLLERSGVSPKLAQELARHSDMRLTMNVYTHTRREDLATAIDGLPALLGEGFTTREGLLANGTEPPSVCTGFAQTNATGGDCSIPTGTIEGTEEHGVDGVNLLLPQGDRTDCDSTRLTKINLPRLDSNQDKESQNLLCYRYTTG